MLREQVGNVVDKKLKSPHKIQAFLLLGIALNIVSNSLKPGIGLILETTNEDDFVVRVDLTENTVFWKIAIFGADKMEFSMAKR